VKDRYGLREAEQKGIALDQVGQEILYEDEGIRIWGIALDPGDSQAFHFHRHPYVVISLGGNSNEIQTIFGDVRKTLEPAGNIVVRDEVGPVHRLTNVSDTPYACRLIEIKTEEWTSE
jgi:hypothetical protein